MKNADMPAMANIIISSEGSFEHIENIQDALNGCGLSKREMFAMHAMQGVLSNSGGVIQGNNYSGTGWCNSNAADLAKLSLECADALLKELEK